MEKAALKEEIKSRLGIQDSLAEDFADQVIRLTELQQNFEPDNLFFRDKDSEIEELLSYAAKALRPDQNAYRLAFVGPTGAGKSQLINALLGRPLLPTQQVESVTGVPAEVFFNGQAGQETVRINLRTEKDILTLIEKFNQDFRLNIKLPEQLSSDFSVQLAARELNDESANAERRHQFRRLRDALTHMVACYVQNNPRISTFLFPGRVSRSFSSGDSFFESPLSQEVEEHVAKLINENDAINRPEYNRPIDLIDSVTYKINLPEYPHNQAQFRLPSSVCLVDLPGLNIDRPIHNLIFAQGVSKANVIIITLDPNRLPDRDSYLYELTFKSNLVTTDPDSPKSIFLVINRWDEFQRESRVNVDKLHGYLSEVKAILRVDNDYKTSAFVAFNAQLGMQNKRMDTPDKYRAGAGLLGSDPDNYEGTLDATRVPELVADIMEFVHNRLILNELDKGRRAINAICGRLRNRYMDLSKDGSGNITEAIELVSECQQDVEKILYGFRKEHLRTETESLRQRLKTEANDICDYIDSLLERQDKIPTLWKQCLQDASEEIFIKPYYKEKRVVRKAAFLGRVELEIWKELPQHMTRLSSALTDTCRKAIESKNVKGNIIRRITTLTPSVNAIEVIANLDKAIAEMGKKLDELSEHVVLLRTLDNDVSFFEEEVNGEDGKITGELERVVDRLPQDEDLPPVKFRELIKAVRSRYESVVSSWSIDMLLNFYQYQLAYIDAAVLRNDIKEFFSKVYGCVYYDPSFCAEVLTIAAYPDPQDREALVKKREVLSRLCGSSADVRNDS